MSLLQPALVLARMGQYVGTSGLFGGAFFLARQHPDLPSVGEYRLLMVSGLLLMAATVAGLVLQAADMAGGTDLSMMAMVLTSTSFGHAAVSRLVVVAAALLVLLNQPSPLRLWLLTALGAVATTSLAWGGHAMSGGDDAAGLVHFSADIVHLLAAAIWIGALGILATMVAAYQARTGGSSARRLNRALSGFSGVGTVAVGLLILSGLINGWFLVGPDHLRGVFTTLYGRLMLIKLALFTLMLGLAALHRWRLTPRLETTAREGADMQGGVIEIRRGIALETVSAMLVLGLVAWFGTLAPPNDG